MSYLEPLIAILLAITLLGLVLARYRKTKLPVVGLVGLFAVSWPPAAWLLSRPLEAGYAIRAVPTESAEAIVVFGSTVSPPQHERPYPLPDRETYRRCEFGAWLYRHWRPLPILACGGRTAPNRLPMAGTMRDLLCRAGVPEVAIWTEEVSNSTHTNAVYAAQILAQHRIQRIALVVDARSMPRAAACFRKLNIAVVPAPSSFYELDDKEDLIPGWKAIEANEITLHEVLGLIWYRIRGWI